jgi:hypothetical protein
MMRSLLVSIERQKLMRTFVKRLFVMVPVVRLGLAAALGACALGVVGLHAASAADMPMPQADMQPPPPDYGPPPAGYAYPPPPAAYGPPPAIGYAYPRPRYVGPYRYGRGPYWRGYGPHYGFRYARWRRNYWR